MLELFDINQSGRKTILKRIFPAVSKQTHWLLVPAAGSLDCLPVASWRSLVAVVAPHYRFEEPCQM